MPGRAERLGFGGHFGAPSRRREPEERHGYAGARRTLGVWGPFRGPQQATRTRGAPRLCRGAPNVWGFGGHFVAPSRRREPEERHGYAGARRTVGGLGAVSGPPSI